MPFLEYDPREHPAYKDVRISRDTIVPTTDSSAWWLNQDYCHVYNKLDLALNQGLTAGPFGVEPDSFPIFMKPIINMWGGGYGSRKIKSNSELEEYGHPGMFWMPLLNGRHISHDFIIQDGEIIYYWPMEGKAIGNGMFDYWKVVSRDKSLFDYLASWIRENLEDYTGMVNLETIGGKIIEAHLRWGDSWCSGDAALIQAVVELYATGDWTYEGQPEPFYVWPVWGEHKINYKLAKDIADEIETETLVGDLEHEDEGPTPIGGRRLALFSTRDKAYGRDLRKRAIASFKPKIPRKYREKLS